MYLSNQAKLSVLSGEELSQTRSFPDWFSLSLISFLFLLVLMLMREITFMHLEIQESQSLSTSGLLKI